MKAPTISIITATFNVENDLPYLISTLRAQTDRDFEWIVIDGASNDKTIEILKESPDIVSYWISETDFGIYDALNKGIRISTGEYYLVLGADDLIYPNTIEMFKAEAMKSQADLITAGIIKNENISFGKLGKSWLHGMFAYVSGHSVGTLIRKNLHTRFGEYSRRFPVAADMFFLKTVCKSSDTSLCHASFIAGVHGTTGLSNTDKAATYCDCFRVQLETEKVKLIQIIIFILKLLFRTPSLIKNRSQLKKSAKKKCIPSLK